MLGCGQIIMKTMLNILLSVSGCDGVYKQSELVGREQFIEDIIYPFTLSRCSMWRMAEAGKQTGREMILVNVAKQLNLRSGLTKFSRRTTHWRCIQ